MQRAQGTFAVRVSQITQVPPPAEGLGRFSLEKEIQGDLEGTSKGEMLTGGDPKTGAAGAVAIELVTGTLAGKKGSFALQHSSTMDAGGYNMSIIVVPGSGTGELQGIAGTFTIRIVGGEHFYDFDYTLPE